MLRLIRTKEVFELTPYWNHFMGFLSILLPGLKNFTSIITLTAALLSFTHLTACTLYFAGLPEFDTHDCNEHGEPSKHTFTMFMRARACVLFRMLLSNSACVWRQGPAGGSPRCSGPASTQRKSYTMAVRTQPLSHSATQIE